MKYYYTVYLPSIAIILALAWLLCDRAQAQQAPFDSKERAEYRKNYEDEIVKSSERRTAMTAKFCAAAEDEYIAAKRVDGSKQSDDDLRILFSVTDTGKYCIDRGFKP